ncbi:hypothetical protein Tco_0676534 [Tanacetum coccineum]
MNASMVSLITVLCLLATETVRACYEQLNQGTALLNFRPARYVAIVAPIMILEDFIQQRYLDDGLSSNEAKEKCRRCHLY